MKSPEWHMGQFGCNNPWTSEHLVPEWDIHYGKKVKTLSCQIAHKETVKKNLHWQNTLTCWILFILGIVINDVLFPPLILYLGSGLLVFSFFFFGGGGNIPALAKVFSTLDFKVNKLIDWLVDCGQGVLIWTVWIRQASTVLLRNRSRWPVFGLYASSASSYLLLHMSSISLDP